MKKIFIIAGEVSGDMHAAHLISELKKQTPTEISFMGIGGDKMKAEGVTLIEHISNISFLGLTEVLKNLSVIKKVLTKTKDHIRSWEPDALILIDYPGFNLKMAKFAKQLGIKTIYYICPQIWAWGEHRVKKIRENIDQLLVILPFEEQFYNKHGLKATFVGHPSFESIMLKWKKNEFDEHIGRSGNEKIVGLLPGSRIMEINSLLKPMLDAAKGLNDEKGPYRFILAKSNNISHEIYQQFLDNYPDLNVKIIEHAPYDVMNYSDILWVASGTASLEAGLLGTPSLVLYKVNPLTYFIGKMVVKVPYISLTDLILEREIFPELIQSNCTPENIISESKKILTDPELIHSIKSSLTELTRVLNVGHASQNAAKLIIDYLQG